ncbi:hypothetical protein WN943_009576 [Citrus x changshan-huyou]
MTLWVDDASNEETANDHMLMVSSPSLVKQVVRDQDITFANRDPPIAGLVASFGGNDILFSNYGPEWRKLRKLFVGKLMSNASLDACYALRKQENMLWGEALELREKGISNLGAELKFKLAELVVLMGTQNISDIIPCFHGLIYKKVQEELAQVVGMDSCVEEFHLPKLKYLDAVVKETFRLHSVPYLVPRRASQSSSIGGYTVPKDTTIILNVWAIHRDPQIWDNPLEFGPEKFFNDGIASKFDYSGNNFQYLPFGAGRRMCAGIALAERMLMFVLASLLHSFDWKLPAGTKLDLSEKFGILIKKKEPLVAIPTPRLPNSELYQ